MTSPRTAVALGLALAAMVGACAVRGTPPAASPAAWLDPAAARRVAGNPPLPPVPPDPTNRFADSLDAARLGHRLFFDARLSASGTVSCASCHDPARSFSDPRPLAVGEGTGLGLSVSYGIIESMGGTIGYRRGAGGGAVFYFELPARSA